MRIVMLAAANSIHTQRWANGLAGLGHDIHLVSSHEPLEGYHETVTLHGLPHSPPFGYLTNRRAVRAIVRRLDPDVVNTHYASGYGLLGRLARLAPTVLNVWGADVYDVPNQTPLHRGIIRKNLATAEIVSSTSHVMAEQSRRVCPEIRRLEVVPFGVDTSRFSAGPGFPPSGDITIGTVKTLAPKYGVDTLIAGFHECRRRLALAGAPLASRLRLRLVGDGPQRAELEALSRRLGVGPVTTFVGPAPHERVPSELCKLDVYVSMSRLDSESFGVAVVEALSAERPVVVSDAGGLPEVVKHRETGLVAPRDNPSALADALIELLESPGLAAGLASRGRSDVQRRYEWSVNLSAMEELLGEVARAPASLRAA